MTGWLAANLRDRAAYDVACEADRASVLCLLCGAPDCGSALCETKRRKAEQQAKAQVMAARAGVQ